MLTYFHGSITDQIESFRPFSHFGSLDQALAIISKKQDDWAEGNRKLTGNAEPVPTVYEVELAAAVLAKPLTVDDWGTPMVIGIAKAARDAFDIGGKNPCTVRWSAFEEIRAKLVAEKIGWQSKSDEGRAADSQALQERGWQLISTELLKQGWTCLSYSNIVEGASPAPSICIPDPKHVRIISRRTPSKQELKQALLQSKPLK